MTENKTQKLFKDDGPYLVEAVDAGVAEQDQESPDTSLAPNAATIVENARANATMAEEDRNFEWRATQNDCVVCPEQRSIAIYTNPYGQAVIRQERSWDEEDDPFICIGKHYLQDVIDRLQAILSEG